MIRRSKILRRLRSNNIHSFTWDEITETINFCRDYALDPSKTKENRTSGGKDSFGGIFDRFTLKGLTEIATCHIIGKYTLTKVLLNDSRIHKANKDPDIYSVHDKLNDIKRDPNLHVEVKTLPSNFNWLVVREEQIKKYEGNRKDYYLVYVLLYFDYQTNMRKNDITGSIMREIMDKNKYDLSNFSDISNLRAKIVYITNWEFIIKNGIYAPAGSFLPSTDLRCIKESLKYKTGKEKGKLRPKFKLLNRIDTKQKKEKYLMKPDVKIKKSHDLSNFEDWEIEGDVSIYENTTTHNELIFANTRSVVEQKNIGKFILEKNSCREFFLKNVLNTRSGDEETKGTSEYVISKRKVQDIIAEEKNYSAENLMKIIAEKI